MPKPIFLLFQPSRISESPKPTASSLNSTSSPIVSEDGYPQPDRKTQSLLLALISLASVMLILSYVIWRVVSDRQRSKLASGLLPKDDLPKEKGFQRLPSASTLENGQAQEIRRPAVVKEDIEIPTIIVTPSESSPNSPLIYAKLSESSGDNGTEPDSATTTRCNQTLLRRCTELETIYECSESSISCFSQEVIAEMQSVVTNLQSFGSDNEDENSTNMSLDMQSEELSQKSTVDQNNRAAEESGGTIGEEYYSNISCNDEIDRALQELENILSELDNLAIKRSVECEVITLSPNIESVRSNRVDGKYEVTTRSEERTMAESDTPELVHSSLEDSSSLYSIGNNLSSGKDGGFITSTPKKTRYLAPVDSGDSISGQCYDSGFFASHDFFGDTRLSFRHSKQDISNIFSFNMDGTRVDEGF